MASIKKTVFQKGSNYTDASCKEGDVIIHFGKFKGKKLREIPRKYLLTYLDIPITSDKLKEEIGVVLETSRDKKIRVQKEIWVKKRSSPSIKMPLGSHQGFPLKDIPVDDLKGYLRSYQLEPKMRRAIKNTIAEKGGWFHKKRKGDGSDKIIMKSGPFKGTPIEDIPYRFLKESLAKMKIFPKFIQKEIKRVLELRKAEDLPSQL